jgi:hypothetical protein
MNSSLCSVFRTPVASLLLSPDVNINTVLRHPQSVLDFIYLQFILWRSFSNKDYIMSNERVTSEQWIGKDLEGIGCGLILMYCPSICLEELRKTIRKTSVRIADLRAEIWAWDLPNMKQVLTLDHGFQ